MRKLLILNLFIFTAFLTSCVRKVHEECLYNLYKSEYGENCHFINLQKVPGQKEIPIQTYQAPEIQVENNINEERLNKAYQEKQFENKRAYVGDYDDIESRKINPPVNFIISP